MEKIVEQTLLYDFYGELLTAHQKKIYEEVFFHDLTISEVAEQEGVSRQGIHDLIKRCNKLLAEYESKLLLVEKFMKTKSLVGEIQSLTKQYMDTKEAALIQRVAEIANEISRL